MKTLGFTILLAVALAACASPPGGSQRFGLCSQPNDHCIEVTVGKDASGQDRIFVDVSELSVRGANHVIYWRIANAPGQAYSFPDDGIFFKSDAGKRQFTCRRMPSADTVFMCVDPNSAQGRFEYGVKVDGKPGVPVLDPWIINQL